MSAYKDFINNPVNYTPSSSGANIAPKQASSAKSPSNALDSFLKDPTGYKPTKSDGSKSASYEPLTAPMEMKARVEAAQDPTALSRMSAQERNAVITRNKAYEQWQAERERASQAATQARIGYLQEEYAKAVTAAKRAEDDAKMIQSSARQSQHAGRADPNSALGRAQQRAADRQAAAQEKAAVSKAEAEKILNEILQLGGEAPEVSENRFWDTLKGFGKTTASAFGNAGVTLLDWLGRAESQSMDTNDVLFAMATGRDIGQEAQKKLEGYDSKENQDFRAQVYGSIDSLGFSGEQDLERAKAGLGNVGQFAVDTGVGALQYATDALLGLINPALATASLATRTFGSTTQEARLAGASELEQMLYGGSTTAVAVVFNRLFDGLGGLYGKKMGIGDDFVEALAAKASTNAGRNAIRLFGTEVGEFLEEFGEGAIEPVLRAIYDQGEQLRQIYSSPEAWADAFLGNIRSGLIGAALAAPAQGVDIARGRYDAKNSLIDIKKIEAAKKAQDASKTAGDKEIPPNTQTASTKQTGELNSQGNDDGEIKYSRAIDEYGFNVRNEPSGAAATETAKEDGEVSSKSTTEADKPKDSIDVLLEAAGVSDAAVRTEKAALLPPDLRVDVYNDAKEQYANEVKKFWAAHPELNKIPIEHPLADKESWIKKRANDILYKKSVEIREEIFNIKDDRNIPIKERLSELQALAEQEYSLGLVEEKRDWHIVDGEIVDATVNKENIKTGDQRPTTKTVEIPDTSVSIRGLSMREEPPARVGTKVTKQMRDMGQSEKKTPSSNKSSLNNPLTETVLQKQAENDKLSNVKNELEKAIELSESGAMGSEVYNQTGYMLMANGNIVDPASGEVVWEAKNGEGRRSSRYPPEYEEGGASVPEISANDGRGIRAVRKETVGRKGTPELSKERKEQLYSDIESIVDENYTDAFDDYLYEFEDANLFYQKIIDDYNESPQALERWASLFGEDGIEDIKSAIDNAYFRDETQTSESSNSTADIEMDNSQNLSPKAQAKEDFGFAYDSIQESAKKVQSLKMFTEDERFKKAVGNKSSDAVNQAVGGLVQTIRDYSNGFADIRQLSEAYKKASKDDALKLFASDRILKALDRAENAYDIATSEQTTDYDVRRYRHASKEVMKLVARRFELADQAVKNNLSFAEAAKKNAPKSFKGNTAKDLLSGYTALQISGPNVFRWIDGFNPNSKGIGNATANAAEDCAVVESTEKVNGNKFFSKLDYKNKGKSFFNGKEKTGVKVDGYELNQLQAVHFIYEYKTLLATGKNKMDKMKGLAIPDGKKMITLKIPVEEGESVTSALTGIVTELEDSLSDTAKEYVNAMVKAFEYYKPKLQDTTEDVYGTTQKMFEKGSYAPVRWYFEGKEIGEYSLAEDIENSVSMEDDSSIGAPSILHGRTKKSGEYLLVEPITEVMNRYINQASEYIAYAGFAQRLELMNTSSVLAPSVSETLSENFGESFGKWMNDYVSDMKLSKKADDGDKNMLLSALNSGVGYLRKGLQQGALLFNAGTPIKQGAAYWTSMGILKPEAVMKAWVGNFGGVISNDAKGNAIYEGRKLGGMDPTLNEILRQSDTWLGKLKSKSSTINFLANAIGEADAAVVRKLFTATIYDVASDNPGMNRNSPEFRRLVENKFEEVMLLTQSTSARSIAPALQRTDNELLKITAMFRSQQMQELNKMIKLFGEANAAKGTDLEKQTSKALRAGIAGQVASYLSLSIANAAVNLLLLHKRDQYEDEEGELDPTEILKKISIDFAENAAGSLWFGESAAQWLIEEITDENEFYGIPLGPINTISSFAESVGRLMDKPSLPNLKKTIGYAGTLTGVPLNNVYSVINSAIMWSKDIAGTNKEGYDDILKYVQAKIDKSNEISYAATGASTMERIGWIFGIDAPTEQRRAAFDAVESLMEETGKTSYTPAGFEGKIEYDNEEYVLDEKQDEKYRETSMDTYYSVVEDIINDAVYKNASTAGKEAIVKKAKEYATNAAKAEYFKAIGVDYDDKYDNLHDGVVVRGTDSDGNPKPDIPPVKAQDIPEYLAYTASYSGAVKSEDYKGVDRILNTFSNLPTASQLQFINSYGNTVIEVHKAGVSHASYMAYKNALSSGTVVFDANTNTNRVMLYAITKARMTERERDALAEVILNKNALKAYKEARKNGYAISQAVDIYIKKYQ